MKKQKNTNLHKAKREQNNEFYTQLTDIDKELNHYKDHFKGKTVLLNCDDPERSNFWKHFELKFQWYGLKKLIATHYDTEKPTYKLELTGDITGDGKVTPADIVRTPLKQNGDFRSAECVELLKEADIVVTNPPFSLAREYVAQLMEHDKKFVVMGTVNWVTYKEIFPLIKDGKLWAGYGFNKTIEFEVPEEYAARNPKARITDGKSYVKVPSIAWYTNLPVKRRMEELETIWTYKGNEDKYPKYDNYEAINVDKVSEIPMDYTEGVLGVPITFLDKHNPAQFDLLGIANSARWIGWECFTRLKGQKIYNRLIIKRKTKQGKQN
jgi:hypothetical protein